MADHGSGDGTEPVEDCAGDTGYQQLANFIAESLTRRTLGSQSQLGVPGHSPFPGAPQPQVNPGIIQSGSANPSYRVPSSLWTSANIRPHGPLFSVPVELWLVIISNLDMPTLERLLAALFFIFRPLGIFPTLRNPVLSQIVTWLANGGASYEVLTKYPYEIVEDIFSQLGPQDKINVVLALYDCNRR